MNVGTLLVRSATPCGNDLHTGRSRSKRIGHAVAPVMADRPTKAPENAPADLLAFVGATAVTEVARVLGMSRKTAYRLRQGYWPADARALLKAWDTYKGRNTHQQSGWFLRRIHTGGVVRHAGYEWTAPGLAVRIGQTLAVARATDSALLAQTLELPSERFTLSVKG